MHSTPVLETLRHMKNRVIGNPLAKAGFGQTDVDFLVRCLSADIEGTSQPMNEIRMEAAHVISSLSYGSLTTLDRLLNAHSHKQLLDAIASLQPSDPPVLKDALVRALRTLSMAIADEAGPSQWGLGAAPSYFRADATAALDDLFQLDALDTFLPLLVDPSSQTSTSVAQLLASSLRTERHRASVTQWLPRADRSKEVKGKRGWEKPETTKSNAPGRHGGWVARNLATLLNTLNPKIQESTMAALAALAKDNVVVASAVSKPWEDHEMYFPLGTAVALSKSRHRTVQLAACLCATHILRADPSTRRTSTESPPTLTLIHVLNHIIASPAEPALMRTKACFILCQLVTDDKDLCRTAVEHGSLAHLAELAKSMTPTQEEPTWDDDEPESISCLREAALTGIATLSLFDNHIRERVTDEFRLIRTIHLSLSHRHVGVRYAACQCVRTLGRAVAVVRTSIMDTGLGLGLFATMMKEDEDQRVTTIAVAAVCNLVNDHSPLRSVLLERGVVPRLVQLLDSDHEGIKLNCLWAFKNLVYRSSMAVKRAVMDAVDWDSVARLLLLESNPSIQEQAVNIVQNIASDEDGVDMVFDMLGLERLLETLETILESRNEHVLRQAMCLLANLSNGSNNHRVHLLSRSQILRPLRSCLEHANVDIRRPAVSCVLELALIELVDHNFLRDAGIESTLRHMCGGAGVHVHGSVGSPIIGGTQMGFEEDKEIREKAHRALRLIESSRLEERF